MRRILFTALLAILFLAPFRAMATHIRAADIIAIPISGKTYLIQLYLYTDAENVANPGSGNIDMSVDQTLRINGDEYAAPRVKAEQLENLVVKNVYQFEHTFPSANNTYTIAYEDIFRNAEIVNMSLPESQGMYVETVVFIDGLGAGNSTPRLLVPPIDVAQVGQPFTHNPGAWDPDGDSVSFEGLVSSSEKNVPVLEYRFPDDPVFGSPSSYHIDPITGTITWDTPLAEGEYNIAFQINEWRNGVRIGYVIRDMQIFVQDGDNIVPEIILPIDTCLAAGVTYRDTIIAFDPNGDNIEIEMYGGPAAYGAKLIDVDYIRPDSLLAIFEWTPSCDGVQRQDLQAIFRVVDDHKIPLTSIKTWEFQVSAPEPEGFSAFSKGDDIELTWDKYLCHEDAQTLQIWRITCDSANVLRDYCTPGVPEAWGFQNIASIAPGDSVFLDTGYGEKLERGIKYLYLMSAEYANPSNGEGYASDVVFASLEIDRALITGVSVTKTDKLEGEIQVSWNRPPRFDSVAFTGPYSYEIYRSPDLLGSAFLPDPVGVISIPDQPVDTFFMDTKINTGDTGYSYKIAFLSGDEVITVSDVVSSVLLVGDGLGSVANVNWESNVNWFYADTLYQFIYKKDSNEDFLKVDSLLGGNTQYIESYLRNGDTVCYKVKTTGAFCSEDLVGEILNYSNEVCLTIKDTVPPCEPQVRLDHSFSIDLCEDWDTSKVLGNRITWDSQFFAKCDSSGIKGFYIWFQDSSGAPLVLIDSVIDPDANDYVHDSIDSFAGCYAVTVADIYNNMSSFSELVCNENCEYFELPNIFTPNGDGKNDLFVPVPVPRFVKSVEIWIYNRWGKLVYYEDDNINIEWDGVNLEGKEVTDGLYYYIAKVAFFTFDQSEDSFEVKNWLQIVR